MECFLPFAQTVASRSEVFQLRFARAAAELLAANHPAGSFPASALSCGCGADGIELSAEDEDTLAEAVTRLQAVYGNDLNIGEVRVRYRREPMLLEPVMRVEVSVPGLFGQRALNILRAREVVLSATENDGSLWRMTGEGRAARVLGLRGQLDVLTNRTAVTQLSLLGFFTPPPGPDGGDAA